MKIRIEQTHAVCDVPTTEYSKGWFGRVIAKTTMSQTKRYNVELYLELSEEQRAIILHNRLDELVIESVKLDLSDEIDEINMLLSVVTDPSEI